MCSGLPWLRDSRLQLQGRCRQQLHSPGKPYHGVSRHQRQSGIIIWYIVLYWQLTQHYARGRIVKWYDCTTHCTVLTTLLTLCQGTDCELVWLYNTLYCTDNPLDLMPGDGLWTGMIVQHTVLYWQPSWPYARGQIVKWYDCAAEDTKLYWHSCVTKCLDKKKKAFTTRQNKRNHAFCNINFCFQGNKQLIFLFLFLLLYWQSDTEYQRMGSKLVWVYNT